MWGHVALILQNGIKAFQRNQLCSAFAFVNTLIDVLTFGHLDFSHAQMVDK